jgi:hypothetical protein
MKKLIQSLVASTVYVLLVLLPVLSQAAGRHKILVVAACGFGKDLKSEYNCSDDVPPTLEKLLSRMMFSNGLKNNVIHIEEDDFIDMPVSAITDSGKIEIIVNPAKIGDTANWYVSTILAHELAHIYNGDLYSAKCVNIEHELLADYYAGFWAHRHGCTNIALVYAPLKDATPDQDHPDSTTRMRSALRGWKDEEVPFILNPNDTNKTVETFSQTYAKYADVFVTVTPSVYTTFPFRKHNRHTIVFHLTSTDFRVPTDSIFNKISAVSYYINEDHFDEKVKEVNNYGHDGYAYGVTKVWNEFPVTCVIYFKDDSVLPITKRFKLSENPKN